MLLSTIIQRIAAWREDFGDKAKFSTHSGKKVIIMVGLPYRLTDAEAFAYFFEFHQV